MRGTVTGNLVRAAEARGQEAGGLEGCGNHFGVGL